MTAFIGRKVATGSSSLASDALLVGNGDTLTPGRQHWVDTAGGTEAAMRTIDGVQRTFTVARLSIGAGAANGQYTSIYTNGPADRYLMIAGHIDGVADNEVVILERQLFALLWDAARGTHLLGADLPGGDMSIEDGWS